MYYNIKLYVLNQISDTDSDGSSPLGGDFQEDKKQLVENIQKVQNCFTKTTENEEDYRLRNFDQQPMFVSVIYFYRMTLPPLLK